MMDRRRNKGGGAMRGHINRIRTGRCKTLIIMTVLFSAWMMIHFTRTALENNVQDDSYEDEVIEKNIEISEPQYPEQGFKRLKPQKTEQESTTELYEEVKSRKKQSAKFQKPDTKNTNIDIQKNLRNNLKETKNEKEDEATTDATTDDYEEYELKKKHQSNMKNVLKHMTTTDVSLTELDMRKAVNTTPASLTYQNENTKPTPAPKKIKINNPIKKNLDNTKSTKSSDASKKQLQPNNVQVKPPVGMVKQTKMEIKHSVIGSGPSLQSDDVKPTVAVISEPVVTDEKLSSKNKGKREQTFNPTLVHRSLLENVTQNKQDLRAPSKTTNNGTKSKKTSNYDTENTAKVNKTSEFQLKRKFTDKAQSSEYANKLNESNVHKGEEISQEKIVKDVRAVEKNKEVLDTIPAENSNILERMKNIKQQEKSIQSKWSEVSNEFDKHLNQVIEDNQ